MEDANQKKLTDLSLSGFSEELASDSPAPGGGSAAAYAGALAASLGTMVANLSAHKRGWEEKHPFFVEWALKGQEGRNKLLQLVDEDTRAFNSLIEAFRMPKETDADKQARTSSIQKATMRAIDSPLHTMRAAFELFPLLDAMTREGNPNSVSDAGVGAVCALAAVEGGYMNVMINLSGLKDKQAADAYKKEAEEIWQKAVEAKKKIIETVLGKLD
jgi:glutamate formiminotransferase/formiminotetrahydrofolate cyclodeaminase